MQVRVISPGAVLLCVLGCASAYDQTYNQEMGRLHSQERARQQQEEAAREEARKFVRASIDKLPESYRLVLLLRDIDEWDTHETARLLGLTTSAVKVRLHRARLALRTLLADRFEMETA